MTRNELTERLNASMECRMVDILRGIADDKFSIKNSNDYFTVKDVMDLTFHPKKEVAFRSAWMLEYIFTNYSCIGDYLDDFFSLLPAQRNQSAMRHYGKITAYVTGKKVTGLHPGQLEAFDFDLVIEVLFGWLIDEKVLVASKVHSMQALANLAPRYTWIKEELLETIDHLADQETVAFFGRAKQVRKALKKIRV